LVRDAESDKEPAALPGEWKWNMRNDKNEEVVSGVYIYLITNPDDKTGKEKCIGKIIIVR